LSYEKEARRRLFARGVTLAVIRGTGRAAAEIKSLFASFSSEKEESSFP
jgi:hypothetical protein